MRSSTVPARVSQSRSRSRCAAPAGPANARHSRRRSGPAPRAPSAARRQSRSSRATDRRRCSSQSWRKCDPVVGHRGGLRSGVAARNPPYRRSRDDHPLWIAGLPTPNSWRSLRQATYPQLLHHHPGRDPPNFRHRLASSARLGLRSGAAWSRATNSADAFLDPKFFFRPAGRLIGPRPAARSSTRTASWCGPRLARARTRCCAMS